MVSVCDKNLKFGIWAPDTWRQYDFERRLIKTSFFNFEDHPTGEFG